MFLGIPGTEHAANISKNDVQYFPDIPLLDTSNVAQFL